MKSTYQTVSTMHTVDVRNALIDADNARDIARIDEITDWLAQQGIVRPRDSVLPQFLPLNRVAAA